MKLCIVSFSLSSWYILSLNSKYSPQHLVPKGRQGSQCSDRVKRRGFHSRKGGEGIVSHRDRVQTSSGVHPTTYPMGIGGKAAGGWSRPLISI